MIRDSERISRTQYLALCFTALLSPLIRQLPRFCPAVAGRGAWLAGFFALPVLLLFEAMMSRLTAHRAEGEGMGEIFLRVWGKSCGKILLAAYALWMLAYAAFVILGGGRRLAETAYPRGGEKLFLLVMGALALLPALGKARSLCRMANVLRPLLLAAVLLVLLFALPGMKPGSLLPLTGKDVLPAGKAGLRTANVLLLLGAFRFLEGFVPPAPKKDFRRFSLLLGGTALLGSALLAVLLGVFGVDYTLGQAHPFFALAKNLRLAGLLERVEPLVIGLWVLTDFLLISALLQSAGAIFRLVLKTESRVPRVISAALVTALALAAAVFKMPTAFFAERFFPVSGAVIAFGLYPATFVLGLVRKKI